MCLNLIILHKGTHTHTQKKIVSKHSFYSYGEFQKTFFFLNILLANWSARDLNECFSDILKIKPVLKSVFYT